MKRDVFVLYIQFTEKLDQEFIYLSRVFNQFGISLVPISVNDLKKHYPSNQEYVLAIVKDINSAKEYKKLLKKFLNLSIRSDKIFLFEFPSIEFIHDVKFLKDKKEITERLPVSMFGIAERIGSKIYHDLTAVTKKWPGGRRAKLPTL